MAVAVRNFGTEVKQQAVQCYWSGTLNTKVRAQRGGSGGGAPAALVVDGCWLPAWGPEVQMSHCFAPHRRQRKGLGAVLHAGCRFPFLDGSLLFAFFH